MMDNETLTRILSARFITCNEQARKGSKGCTKECKLYELQEPGMTCRDSVLLHAEEAKKILKIRSHNSRHRPPAAAAFFVSMGTGPARFNSGIAQN
jgi:hypothetical protein